MSNVLLFIVIVILAISILGDIGIVGALLVCVGIFLLLALFGMLIEKVEKNTQKRKPVAQKKENDKRH